MSAKTFIWDDVVRRDETFTFQAGGAWSVSHSVLTSGDERHLILRTEDSQVAETLPSVTRATTSLGGRITQAPIRATASR
jgi:hypothetical protein